MPISEDDYSAFGHNSNIMSGNSPSTTTTMSKAELRKSHKPIMEKRRRAKINNCLNEIKDLILKAMKKDPERHSKLEKADILEMAVKHLKAIQQKQKDQAIRSDPNVAMKYKSGYVECVQEVSQYVNQMDGVESGLKQRLSHHLTKCASDLEQQLADNSNCTNSPFPTFASSTLLASFAQAQQKFEKSFALAKNDDHNNNQNRVQGIELIPSCLPNGDFAFLVPKSSFTSILSQSKLEMPDRPSAFVTVTPKIQLRPSISTQEPLDSQNLNSGLLKVADCPQVHEVVASHSPLSPKQEVTTSTGFKIVKPKPEKAQIQNIKFPIHHKKDFLNEPLSIITNSAERYRQAQKVDESRHSEENVYYSLKRKYSDDERNNVVSSSSSSGLVLGHRESKRFCPEILLQLQPSTSGNGRVEIADASTSSANHGEDADKKDKNEPMWRPW